MGPLLVTGGTGFLGGELLRRARGRPLAATYLSGTPDRAQAVEWIELDVRDEDGVRSEMERVRPAAVIHTAYRQDGEGARETTVDGAGAVARAAAAVGARLVHMSSDVIFDGTKPSAYDELDPPSPITDYGRAKADAEHAVAEAHPGALLVRTSLIYGHGAQPARAARARGRARRGRARVLRRRDALPGGSWTTWPRPCSSSWTPPSRACSTWRAPTVVSRYEFACLVAGAAGLPSDRIRRASIAESGLDPAAQLRADERAGRRAAPHPHARTARAAVRSPPE